MYSTAFSLLLLGANLVSKTNGALYTNASQLITDSYDYVVVGAGAAGAIIANRLTEDPNITVLLLEAGISNEGILAAQIPLLGPTLAPGTPVDWNYTTTVQAGLNNRSIAYPAGKLLGGGTSLNYMIYTRGSRDDWDQYANITGDSGWAWYNMRPYIDRNEKFVPPPGNVSIDGKYIPSQHSTTGAVDVSLPGFSPPLDNMIIQTTQEHADEWPFNQDMNSGDILGIGWAQATIGDGTRSSSATAYLAPEHLSRLNLDVLLNAQATRLIATGTGPKGVPSFGKVEFAASAEAPRINVTATREIIVCAGAIGTPKLLQLSGIGNRWDLVKLNITSVVNLPDVGERLSDHVFLSAPYNVNGNGSYDGLFRDPALINASIGEWMATKSGPMANGITNHLGWFRLPENSTAFNETADPSSGPESSHFEMIFGNLFNSPGVPPPASGNYVSIVTNLITPTSRGTVKINSTDPFAHPQINPNYLATKFDVLAIMDAFRAGKRFVSVSPWTEYITSPFEDVANTNTDEEIETYVRNHASTVWHPVGTASMSPKGAIWGVVDPDLKVKKVAGLRVVDASILPFLPSAHTQVPIYMAAERAADLIKADQAQTCGK